MYSYICAHQLVLGIARYFSASVMYGSKAMQQLSQTSRRCLNLHIPAHHYLLTMLQPTLLELLQAIYYMITRNWKNSSSLRWIHQPFVAASRMVFIVQQNGLPQSHPKTQKTSQVIVFPIQSHTSYNRPHTEVFKYTYSPVHLQILGARSDFFWWLDASACDINSSSLWSVLSALLLE